MEFFTGTPNTLSGLESLASDRITHISTHHASTSK